MKITLTYEDIFPLLKEKLLPYGLDIQKIDLFSKLYPSSLEIAIETSFLENLLSNILTSERNSKLGIVPAGSLALKFLKLYGEKIKLYDNFKQDKIIRPLSYLKKDYVDKVIIASWIYNDEIRKQLLELGIDPKRIISLKELAVSHAFADFFKRRKKYIGKRLKNLNSKKAIVFISPVFPYTLKDRFKNLKNKGFQVVLLTFNKQLYPFKTINSLKKAFNFVIHTSWWEIPFILENLKANTIITLDGCYDSTLSLFIHNMAQETRCFYEVYDIGELFPEKSHNQMNFERLVGDHLNKIEKESRKELFSKTSGIIYNDLPSGFKEIKKIYNISKKSFFFPRIPCTNFKIPSCRKKPTNKNIHIVSLLNIPLSLEEPLSKSLLDLTAKITNQGIHFHIYNALDEDKKLEPIFRARLSNKSSKFFHYHKPISGQKLYSSISKFHFGWLVYEFSSAPLRKHRHSLPTRFISYLYSGLPIIISHYYEAMASLVKKYRIGVVINLPDIDKLKEILLGEDWNLMVNSIKKLLNKYSMDKFIKSFMNFLGMDTNG